MYRIKLNRFEAHFVEQSAIVDVVQKPPRIGLPKQDAGARGHWPIGLVDPVNTQYSSSSWPCSSVLNSGSKSETASTWFLVSIIASMRSETYCEASAIVRSAPTRCCN